MIVLLHLKIFLFSLTRKEFEYTSNHPSAMKSSELALIRWLSSSSMWINSSIWMKQMSNSLEYAQFKTKSSWSNLQWTGSFNDDATTASSSFVFDSSSRQSFRHFRWRSNEKWQLQCSMIDGWQAMINFRTGQVGELLIELSLTWWFVETSAVRENNLDLISNTYRHRTCSPVISQDRLPWKAQRYFQLELSRISLDVVVLQTITDQV